MCDTRNALIGAFESAFEDARGDTLQSLCEAIVAYRRANPRTLERNRLLQDLMTAATSELVYRQLEPAQDDLQC